VLVLAGVCMGIANANLTDLALGLGGAERRTTTAARPRAAPPWATC
jgi:hypothetical protein